MRLSRRFQIESVESGDSKGLLHNCEGSYFVVCREGAESLTEWNVSITLSLVCLQAFGSFCFSSKRSIFERENGFEMVL